MKHVDYIKINGRMRDVTKLKIWDNGGETLDRYTILYCYDHESDGQKFYSMLGCSEAGVAFSQFTLGIPGKHLGKRIKFTDLSARTQNHILERLSD